MNVWQRWWTTATRGSIYGDATQVANEIAIMVSVFARGYSPAMRPIIVLACWLLATGLSVAEVYKWVDENGVVHYGDRRPDQAAETVDIKAAPPADSVQATDRNRQVDEALRIVTDSRERREASERERDEAIADRQRRQAQCQYLLEHRNKLEQGGFFYRKSDQNRNALSDEEIDAEIAELNHELQENCAAH